LNFFSLSLSFEKKIFYLRHLAVFNAGVDEICRYNRWSAGKSAEKLLCPDHRRSSEMCKVLEILGDGYAELF